VRIRPAKIEDGSPEGGGRSLGAELLLEKDRTLRRPNLEMEVIRM
jgi:hypothetical protein